MKKLYSILGFMILLISPFQQLFAQSSTCATSTPFCTGSPITYPAVTGVASSGSYQCLSSMPNPTWFFLEMQTPGAVDIDLTGGADIDFALWGPYAPGTNLSTVCPTIFSSAANMIDCSFSSSAYEQANIPAGAGNVAGAIYVLLITNYSGSAINITVDQVSGSGVTNCGIVPPCSLSLTCAANVSANSLPCGTSGNVTVPAPTVNYLSGTCGIATLTNSFNGTSNASGLYPVGTTTVTWTATSPVNGATATCTQTVTVTAAGLTSPTVSNASVCNSSPVTLTASGAGGCSGSIEWYTAATGGTAFYTGSSYTFTPVTTTTYYVQESKSTTGGTLATSTASTTLGALADINAASGDDRGGIAVTPTYIYVVGDANTVRMTHALGGATSLPIRDGIFSDLNGGQLYSLWNTGSAAAPAGTSSGDFTVDAIRQMDVNLNYGTTINLSQPIVVTSTTNKAGIFAGAGFLLIYGGGSAGAGNNWYSVSLPSGVVTCVGTSSFSDAYSTENWAHWGWGELISGSYFACYRDASSQTIKKKNVITGAVTTLQTYTNLADAASVVYSPSNNRLYMRYEGTAEFGGTSETVCWVSGTHTGTTTPATTSCSSARVPVTATILSSSGPTVTNASICSSSPVTLGATPILGGTIEWYTASSGGTAFTTGTTYNFTPASSTTYYVQEVLTPIRVTTLATTAGGITDILTTSGDDRGGIAISGSNVYVVGDNNTVRTDLALGSQTSLPIRDGIFCDIGSGSIYSLWNTTTSAAPAGTAPGDYTVNSVRVMDASLNYGATINLSAPFTVSSTTNKAGIFSGCGFLLIYAGGSAAAGNRWYAVSLPSGTVTNLGTRTFTGAYSTENWAVWGWGEFDGTNYYACYRNSGSAAISRMNIATGAVTTIQTYTDLGDMASVIYSPSNSRMYFRHEYSSQFGGTSETLGYVSGTHTGTCPACISARVPVTATVMGIPVNDNICNATTVFVGDNTLNTSSNTCATVESSEPRPYCFKDYDGGGAGHDKVSKTIWCKFTAPVGPPYSYRIYIKTGNESNSPVIPNTAGIFDSELALFNIVSGTPCANTFSTGLVLNTMACSDDHASLVGYPPLNPLYSAFSYTLVPGQTYYIMIDGASYDNAVAGGTKGTREEALLATSTSNNITLTIENDVILPVEWISIRAKKSEDKNRIEWKALFKDGGKIFEIERSEDGKNFKKIGEVKAESANNPDFTYIFDDVLPFSQSYYRIKHTDNSGKEDYSKTVYLNRDAKNFALLELLPNPVREVLTVSFESPSDANVRVSIETVSGSTVYEHQFEAISGTNDMKLNFGHLPKGTYMLKISSSEGQIVKKVVKE